MSLFNNNRGNSFNKREFLLIQNTLAAREIRTASRATRQPTDGTGTRGGVGRGLTIDTSMNGSHRPSTSHQFMSPIKTQEYTHDFTLSSSTSLPVINSPNNSNSNTQHSPTPSFTAADTHIINELSSKALTEAAALRKMQQNLKKTMNKAIQEHKKHSSNAMKLDDNFFMPKKTLIRPDGASLQDVYESKRQDAWGKIIKAQYLEDEVRKQAAREQKLRDNENFGAKLKLQLRQNEERFNATLNSDDKFAKIEEEYSKRNDGVQMQRKTDAVNRQKQFISNALEDIETKRVKRELEYMQEMQAAQIMINKNKQQIAEEEQKRVAKKQHEAKLNEQLYQENLDSIARKSAVKSSGFEEDIRINKQALLNYQKQDMNRKSELDRLLSRSSDGPAHAIARVIVENSRKNEDKLHSLIQNQENGLNKQLKSSEDAALARLSVSGQYLKDSWDEMRAMHAKDKALDDANTAKIGKYMQQKIMQMNQEDQKQRQDKMLQGHKYQEELDVQLQAYKNRSLDSLVKTMSIEETKINSSLIKKAAVYVKQ